VNTSILDTTSVRRWRRYPAYRPSGANWHPEVPTPWQVRRIKFLAGRNPSKTELSGLAEDTQVSFVPMERVSEDGVLSLELTRPLGEVRQGFTYFRNGDVLVAKITPCFENGKGARADHLENGIGFGTTEFHVLRPGASIDGRYLELITRLHAFREQGVSEMSGSAGQQRVPEAFLSNYIAPLPSLPEQRAIAAFLDRETERIDALIGHKERLITLLEEKRQAVISHAVTRGLNPAAPLKDSGIPWLGMVPKHWEVKRLKYSVQFLNYRRIPLSSEERGSLEKIYPYYGASGIIDQVDRYIFDEPLILIGEDGANLLSRSTPLAFIATGKYWVNNHAHILKPKSGQLVYWTERLNSISYEPFVSGSAQPKLTIDSLGSIEFATPDAQEQVKIAKYIEDQDARLSPVVSRVRDGIARLQEYRTALISAAVTGQIDVRGEVTR
jgi:type I restriction enzyme S subunit